MLPNNLFLPTTMIVRVAIVTGAELEAVHLTENSCVFSLSADVICRVVVIIALLSSVHCTKATLLEESKQLLAML